MLDLIGSPKKLKTAQCNDTSHRDSHNNSINGTNEDTGKAAEQLEPSHINSGKVKIVHLP